MRLALAVLLAVGMAGCSGDGPAGEYVNPHGATHRQLERVERKIDSLRVAVESLRAEGR